MPISKSDRIEQDIIKKAYIIGNSSPELHYYKFKALISSVFGNIHCFNSNISITTEIKIKLSKQEYYKFGLLGKKADGYEITIKELNDRSRMILDQLGEVEFISFQYSKEFNMEKIPIITKSYSLSDYIIVDLTREEDIVEWMGLIQIRANRIKRGDSADPFIAIYEQPHGIDKQFMLFELEGYMDIKQLEIYSQKCYCMNLIGEFSQIIFGNSVIKSSK
ncbi:hypothetical protein HK103_002996 [Boothiomyces macroporosus]|uniref:Uncharacterized protein n=1 Tax=Boothiomyces macroporosus TaxID=261099 RepID=A0AAD5Y9D0_9FUNG|nr:hypothetical protein HK103_002996 [Boothiomyces macroporosus]